MGFIPNTQSNSGIYVPTTDVYEINQLLTVDINSEEFKLLLVRLYQNLNAIAIALNLKESAYYNLDEFVNSKLFFPNPSLVVGMTDGSGNASGTVPGSLYQLGQKFVIYPEVDVVVSSTPGAQPMASTGPSSVHTFDIGTGDFVFTGAPINTPIIFSGLAVSISSSYRQDYRLVINIGLLNSGTTTVAHGLAINGNWTFTQIYGTATDNIDDNYYPIPYIDTTGGGVYISLQVNDTDVIINNQSGVTFNSCLVILEYLKF